MYIQDAVKSGKPFRLKYEHNYFDGNFWYEKIVTDCVKQGDETIFFPKLMVHQSTRDWMIKNKEDPQVALYSRYLLPDSFDYLTDSQIMSEDWTIKREVKECPFCGDFPAVYPASEIDRLLTKGFIVRCENRLCLNISGYYKEMEFLVDRWNFRIDKGEKC